MSRRLHAEQMRACALEAFRRGHHQRVTVFLRKAWEHQDLGETFEESLTRHTYMFAEMAEREL